MTYFTSIPPSYSQNQWQRHDNKLVITDLACYIECHEPRITWIPGQKLCEGKKKKKISSLRGKIHFPNSRLAPEGKNLISIKVSFELTRIISERYQGTCWSNCLRWQLTYKLKKKSLVLNEIAYIISICHISTPQVELKTPVWRRSLLPLWNTAMLFCLRCKVI